jgi:hypothetical protein
MRTSLPALVFVGAVAVLATSEGVRVLASAPGGVIARDQVLRDALTRIARGSPSWRDAVGRVSADQRRVLVLTPSEVVVQTADGERLVPFDRSSLAEAAPIVDEAGQVETVVVVVNVDGIRTVHERNGSLPGEFDADLERVLAHEVYGHALPYLEAGHVTGRCPDPLPGEPATTACAIQRENVIRAELRLGRRTDAALGSLGLSRLLPR